MKAKLNQFLINIIKFLIAMILSVAFMYAVKIFIPDRPFMSTTLHDFLYALITATFILACTATTQKMFWAALMSYILPLLHYYFIGLFSPIWIAIHILANFFMVFMYNIMGKGNRNFIVRFFSTILAVFTRFGIFFVGSKLGEKFIEYIMIFKNVTDEAGLEEAVNEMRIDSLNNQLIATAVAGIIAYIISTLFFALRPAKYDELEKQIAKEKAEYKKKKKEERRLKREKRRNAFSSKPVKKEEKTVKPVTSDEVKAEITPEEVSDDDVKVVPKH